jgi:LytS/YehU family sensor histidine kinase
LPIAALLTGILARGGELSWLEALLITVPMCFLYSFMCLAAWYICRTAASALATMGTVTAAALFSSTVWVLIGRSWAEGLQIIPTFAGLSDRYTNQIAIIFLSGVLLFLLAVAVHYLLLLLEESRAAEKRALELQVLAREAELRALRAQIDPHFLFNSLNSISALTIPNPAAARRMCLLLADFMRTSLAVGNKKEIAFGEELKLAESFLEIERVRFGERLNVTVQTDRDCRDCRVPPLLLQPLVENAVRHGIGPLVEGGTVSIEAKKRGQALEILLENPYDAETSRSNGIGLGIRNVRERLANLFAGDARVDVHQSNQRFRVELRLPCKPQ